MTTEPKRPQQRIASQNGGFAVSQAGDSKNNGSSSNGGDGSGSKVAAKPADEPEPKKAGAVDAVDPTKKKTGKWNASTATFALGANIKDQTTAKNTNAAALLNFIRDFAGCMNYENVSKVWCKQPQTSYPDLGDAKGFAANWQFHMQPQAAAHVKQALSAIGESSDSLLRIIKDKNANSHMVNLATAMTVGLKPGLSAMPGTRASTAVAAGIVKQELAWFRAWYSGLV